MTSRKGRALARALRPSLCAAFVSLLLLAPAPAARAQVGGTDSSGTGGRHAIQGRIMSPSGKRAEQRLRVRLESAGFGDLTVYSDANGFFKFDALKPGSYTVIVEGGDEFETHRESVFIDPGNVSTRREGLVGVPLARPVSLQIYLQPKRGNAAAPLASPGVLDASLASVPKPAVEEYNKGMESARQKQHAKAVEHLRAALALHHDFAVAHSALGTQYLALKEPGKAAESLRAALKLAPDDYVILVTYGFALIEQKEYGRAEEPLRQALKKNAALPFAHYQLGVALLRQKRLPEAEASLRRAVEAGIQGEHLSLAHYYLGGLYWASGDYKRAVTELETYLSLKPDLPDAERERVRGTIKELRRKM